MFLLFVWFIPYSLFLIPAMLSRLTSIFSRNNVSRPPTTSATHAQNFSVSQLNYKKDIQNAKVSINQITQPLSQATTSITHVGQHNPTTTTSVAHVGESQVLADEVSQQEADDRRYAFFQRRLMAKKHAEELAKIKIEAEANSGSYTEKIVGNIKTGSGFKTTGVMGAKRQLHHMVKHNPEKYKNLSTGDQKYFLETVKPYAKAVGAGKGFNRYQRRAMKYKFLRDYRSGKISKADYDDFRGLTDNLQKPRYGI